MAKKKWLCLGLHRPPTPENSVSFFKELTDSLSKGSTFYENFIILGDFKIDVKVAGRELDKLEEFCNTFNLRGHKSATDLILTNKPKSFQNICITETGLGDFHKLIMTFLKTKITRLKPRIKVFYRNYKHFEDNRVLENLNNTDFSLNTDDPNKNLQLFY